MGRVVARSLVLGVAALFLLILAAPAMGQVPSGLSPTVVDPSLLSITVRRTSPTEAGVLGTIDNTILGPVDLLVDGSVYATLDDPWTGEYWFANVPVGNGTVVQARVGSTESSAVTVPTYVDLQPEGPPGFVYADGTQLMVDGQPITLFGPNEGTAFSWALIAFAGLAANPDQYRGWNQLFPDGPETVIPGVTTPNELWREYFRYFLHYQQTGNPAHPPSNLLRIWVTDLNFGDIAYDVWESQPLVFYEIFDTMLYWADRAGVYVVPILGQNSNTPPDNAYYDTSSPQYVRHVAFTREVLKRYDNNSRIAMWDLWNEADVWNDAYWGSAGGMDGYRAWLTALVGDVRNYSQNHLFTIGNSASTFVPGNPGFGWRRFFAFNDIPGVDVAHEHSYFEIPDDYLLDWRRDWAEALGIPFYMGEYGYSGSGPSSLGYGYWPWFTEGWLARGHGPVSPMVFLDNGQGAYADYPYLGPLPAYDGDEDPPIPPDFPPVADFDYAPAVPNPGENVTFNASASRDNEGIVRYQWYFADGTPLVEGMVVDHVYANPGAYEVWLTVTDTSNQAHSTAQVVDVVPDTTAPSKVTDLEVVAITNSSAILQWRAPGDDGTQGRASSYDIRFSTTSPLNAGNFGNGSPVPVAPPTPSPSGITERLNVSGLAPDTQYWFALRGADEVPNWSPVSNSVKATTHPLGGPIDDEAPSVTIVSPTNANPVSGDVTVLVNATDNVGVMEVRLSVRGTLAAVLMAAPYLWTWTTADLAPGDYELRAEATDAAGNRGSTQVSVPVVAEGGGPPVTHPAVEEVYFDAEEGVLTISFSEAMDRTSVETALTIVPSVPYEVVWEDDQRLLLLIQVPIPAGVVHHLMIQATAEDQKGTPLGAPFSFGFQSAIDEEPGATPDLVYQVLSVLVGAWIVSLVLFLRSRRQKDTQDVQELSNRVQEMSRHSPEGEGAESRRYLYTPSKEGDNPDIPRY